MSEADLANYYAGLKAYRDNINTLKTAKREGTEEGVLFVAKRGLKKGMSFPEIADLTGLTED